MRVSSKRERESKSKTNLREEYYYSFLTVSKVCRPIIVSSKYYSLLKKNVFHKKIQSLHFRVSKHISSSLLFFLILVLAGILKKIQNFALLSLDFYYYVKKKRFPTDERFPDDGRRKRL